MTRSVGMRDLTRLATLKQKSGLSIVIKAVGLAFSTAVAASLMRRNSSRILGSTSAIPITESSSIGKILSSPWSIINGPPMPMKFTVPPCSDFRPCIKAAPSRSPELSPAMMKNVKASFILWALPTRIFQGRSPEIQFLNDTVPSRLRLQ